MATFTVSNVIDGDTFEVKGGWVWTKADGSKAEGTVVRPKGYNTPEAGKPGSAQATTKLKNLIGGKQVELKNPVTLTYGRLLCDVYYNGKPLADYFPEWKC